MINGPYGALSAKACSAFPGAARVVGRGRRVRTRRIEFRRSQLRFPQLRLAAALSLAPLLLPSAGCRFTDPAGDGRPPAADSLVADLFTLGAGLRLREGGARLTPAGAALMDAETGTRIAEDLVFPTASPVRDFSAYARVESDLHCDPRVGDSRVPLMQFDDGLEAGCRDTLHAWVPSYPYRIPVEAAYLEGKGFWIRAGDIPFVRGRLIIHFTSAP